MGKRYFFDGKPNPSPRRMFRPKHPTVLIALPVADRMCVETVMSLLNFVHHPGPIDLMVNIVSTTVINFARNDLVETAIKQKADYLAFIDADQVFNADYVSRLIAHDKDIIGCPIVKRGVPYTINISMKQPNGIYAACSHFPEDKLFEVDGIGMGFVVIKTKVFEKIEKPWFDFSQKLGEDLYFCGKAKEAGFKIWAEPRLEVGHVGSAVYTLQDYRTFHREMPVIPTFENPELISVIIPTRNRGAELAACLETIKKSTVYPNYEIIIVFDGDEENYHKFNGDYRKILLKNRQEVIRAVNEGLKVARGNIVVNAEDNSVAGKGWLSFAYQKFCDTGKQAIVVLNDTIQRGFVATHFLTSKDVLKELNNGQFYSTEYTHFFGDTDLAMRYKGTPRYRYAKYAILKHLHPTAKTAKIDETYEKSFKESFKRDQEVFEKKHNCEFVIDEQGMYLKKNGKIWAERIYGE